MVLISGLSAGLLVFAVGFSDASTQTVLLVIAWLAVMCLFAVTGIMRMLFRRDGRRPNSISISVLLFAFLLMSIFGIALTAVALVYVFLAVVSLTTMWLRTAMPAEPVELGEPGQSVENE